jgi:hypothetical protein
MLRNSSFSVLFAAVFFVGVISLANYSYKVSPQANIPEQAVLASSTSLPALPTLTAGMIQPTTFPVFNQTLPSSDQALIAFIDSPSGVQSEPYVILSAYFSDGITTGIIKIQGNLIDQTFSCLNSPCRLPVKSSSTITFQAFTDTGLTSNIVQANINLSGETGQITVRIESVTQFTVLSDACSAIWGTSSTNTQSWTGFLQIPSRLNTGKNLHLLASRLITTGIVNAQDCPGGGLDSSGSPNACGLDKALPKVVERQNQYDFNIWAASREVHIPPKIIKTLIEIESQFWPSNERLFLDEIGLGQMNQLGLDVVLRNNPDIYFKLCPTVLGQCNQSYNSLSKELQAMIRGALIDSVNASCPSCPYGIDLIKARQSINLIALVLKSDCQQTKSLMDNVNATANNEDYWKFTIAAYHSGLGCVQSAIEQASLTTKQLDWEKVSPKLACYGGKSYVDNFWNNLETFSTYSLEPGNPYVGLTDATLSTTQNLLPTPTPIIRDIHVLVNVFQDINGNGIPDPNELINNVLVQLKLEDGTILTKTTENGKVDFDMSTYRPGITIIVSLPNYYQYQAITLPSEGQISVDFIFTNPISTKQP